MPTKKQFDVLYYKRPFGGDGSKQFSHKYNEPWEHTELYCPHCGKQQVWREDTSGDYYVGEPYICTSCDHKFYMPDGISKCDDEQDAQRLEHLKA